MKILCYMKVSHSFASARVRSSFGIDRDSPFFLPTDAASHRVSPQHTCSCVINGVFRLSMVSPTALLQFPQEMPTFQKGTRAHQSSSKAGVRGHTLLDTAATGLSLFPGVFVCGYAVVQCVQRVLFCGALFLPALRSCLLSLVTAFLDRRGRRTRNASSTTPSAWFGMAATTSPSSYESKTRVRLECFFLFLVLYGLIGIAVCLGQPCW